MWSAFAQTRRGSPRSSNIRLALVTALNPKIGYARATEVALTAHRQNKTVREVVIEMGLMGSNDLDAILDPAELARGARKL